MTNTYILDGHTPVPEPDLMVWGAWFEAIGEDRIVDRTDIGDIKISTVFLGLDHGWNEEQPILFETLVFEGSLDGEMDRYSTWEEAEAGHKAMVARVVEAEKK